MAARFFMSNGHEYMGSKAVNERIVNYRLKLVDVDGLATDLGMKPEVFKQWRERMFAEIERIAPGAECDRARIDLDGCMTAGFSQAMEFIRRVYAYRAVLVEGKGRHVKHLGSSPEAQPEMDDGVQLDSCPLAHAPPPQTRVPGARDDQASDQDSDQAPDEDQPATTCDHNIATITLAAAERPNFFSMRNLFEGSAAYARVRDKTGKAKRECAKLAEKIALELGVDRREIWEASGKNPNQARIDVLDKFAELFHGSDHKKRVIIDVSQVQRHAFS